MWAVVRGGSAHEPEPSGAFSMPQGKSGDDQHRARDHSSDSPAIPNGDGLTPLARGGTHSGLSPKNERQCNAAGDRSGDRQPKDGHRSHKSEPSGSAQDRRAARRAPPVGPLDRADDLEGHEAPSAMRITEVVQVVAHAARLARIVVGPSYVVHSPRSAHETEPSGASPFFGVMRAGLMPDRIAAIAAELRSQSSRIARTDSTPRSCAASSKNSVPI